jgi:UV DNA damage repair endonuclease
MANRGGKRDGAGRKQGSLNRYTNTVKDSVLEAFEKLGGVKHMVAWAKKHPTDFYRIASKLIPQQINADVQHFHEASELPDHELEHIASTGSPRTPKAKKGAEKLH